MRIEQFFGLWKDGMTIYLRHKKVAGIVNNSFNKVFVEAKSNCSQLRQLDSSLLEQ